MNLSRSMCLADNDDYCMLIMFTDIVMEEEKPPPNALDTKKLVFLFFSRRECHWRAIKLEILHILQRFSAQLRKHINFKDKKRINQHLRLLTSCTL